MTVGPAADYHTLVMRSARSAPVLLLLAALLASGLQGGMAACPYERQGQSPMSGAEAPGCTFTAGAPQQTLIEIHRHPAPALQALPAGAGAVRTAPVELALQRGPAPSAPAAPLYLQKGSLLI